MASITEALAEIKTITKRREKKQAFIMQYIARQDALRDPLSKDGGSVKVLAQEMQALRDLDARQIELRTKIQKSNLTETITVEGITRTVAEWLTWRREISGNNQQFLMRLNNNLISLRNQAAQKGAKVVKEGEDARPVDLIINVDETQLAKSAEDLETILGTLDGMLSLKNATTLI